MEPALAVVVCRHIAEDGAPVKHAIKSCPLREEDSGWQFLCARIHASAEGAKVWAVQEIIQYDNDVAAIIDEPPGSSFEKSDGAANQAFQRTA